MVLGAFLVVSGAFEESHGRFIEVQGVSGVFHGVSAGAFQGVSGLWGS